MVASLRERVEKGARRLDQDRPGWKKGINRDALSIASMDRCVLGQVYGRFETGVQALGLIINAATHGFSRFTFEDEAVWPELDAEWRQFLAEQEAAERA